MMRTLLIALLSCLTVGCATATRGDHQDVKFVSTPSGATVTVDEKGYTTPFTARLKRKHTYVVEASSPGYRNQKFDLAAERDLAAVPQFALPGGSALLAADVATGADKNFPSPIEIVFADQGPAEPPVAMKQFLGRVLHPEDYDKAVADYRQALYNNRPVNQKHPNQPRQ
jgi:hypothetical protein